MTPSLPEEKTITLIKPVDSAGDGGKVYVVELREPTVAEFERFNRAAERDGEIAATKLLISAVSGIDIVTIGNMGVRDFKACEMYLSGFFSLSPPADSP